MSMTCRCCGLALLHCPSNACFRTLTDGFVSLMGRLTALVSETTMVLVEDGVTWVQAA